MEEEKGSSQIFSVTWVQRNVARSLPEDIKLTQNEITDLISNEKERNGNDSEHNDDADWEDIEEDSDAEDPSHSVDEMTEDCSNKNTNLEDDFADLEEYGLDHYDSEDDAATEALSSLVAFSNDKDDPYLKKENDSDSECEQDEKEAITLKSDDNLLVCIRNSQHYSTMEVYVYNHANKDFYVHHDIPLPRNPLCTEWIGYDPGSDNGKGNLLATGTMESVIEIWDLDMMNSIEPVLILGNQKEKNAKKKRKKSKLTTGHSDAVLDLSWSPSISNTLASASVDSTVKLWDLEMGVVTKSLQHPSKVQSVNWKPQSSTEIVYGGFDGEIVLTDIRSGSRASWKLEGEIEKVKWLPGNNATVVASTDTGHVHILDSRKPGEVLHSWRAHNSAVPGLEAFEINNKTLVCTASSDGTVKIWNPNDAKEELLYTKNMSMDMVHCCNVNPDVNSVLAFGGQKDNVKIWNILNNDDVSKYLGVVSKSGKENEELRLEDEEGDANMDVLTFYGKNMNEKTIKNAKKRKNKQRKMNTNKNNKIKSNHVKFS